MLALIGRVLIARSHERVWILEIGAFFAEPIGGPDNKETKINKSKALDFAISDDKWMHFCRD